MDNTSSNKDMTTSMEILKNIKKVQAPSELYDKILLEIEQRKGYVIPIIWVRVAAAVFVCAISIELFYISQRLKPQSTQKIVLLIPIPNNSLYYE